MFFNRNSLTRRTRAPAGALPRRRRCRRASRAWCANRGGSSSSRVAYLALILATYTRDRSRAGRSPGDRRADRATAAAWSARGSPTCCSTCSALSAWWLVVGRRRARRRRLSAASRDPERETDHPLLLGVDRLRAGADRRQRGDRGAALLAARRCRCRSRPAARSATSLGAALARGARLQRRDAAPARRCSPSASRCSSACRGCADGAHRRAASRRWSRWVRAQARGARRPPHRRAGDGSSARQIVERSREEDEEREPIVVVPPPPPVPKSERVVKEKQRPLFTDMPDSPLPPLSLLEEAPPRRRRCSAETLEFTSRLIERKLADFGVAARRCSRRIRGR